MSLSTVEGLPTFLQSYADLFTHITNTLADSSSGDKGEFFAQFVSKFIPISEYGASFGDLELGKRSHDEGIDFVSRDLEQSKILYGQCKLSIRNVDEIDTIFSKFRNYYENYHASAKPVQGTIFENEMEHAQDQVIYFMVVTLSKIDHILSRYESSSRATNYCCQFEYPKVTDDDGYSVKRSYL